MVADIAQFLTIRGMQAFVNGHDWVWPVCEMIHYAGMSLLIGIIGALDLRMLGMFKSIPIGALRPLVPWAVVGFFGNLLTGNIDASVLYSPLSYQMFLKKQARSLIDFGKEVPSHSTGSWIATDKIIAERAQALQKALNALYGGVAFLRAPQNRAAAVKLIAEIDEIPDPIAAAELDGNIVKLSTNGEFKKEWMERALDMARLIGMTSLAPVDQIYVSSFKPVPTA